MERLTTDKLAIGGNSAAREIEVGFEALAAAAAEHQVPDVSELLADREGMAVRFAALAELVSPTAEARIVHVESSDGGFTANIELERALEHGLVLYGLQGEPLPPEVGGPFRLLIAEGDDCSVNVKFLGRVEFLAEPGSHTARCAGDETP